MVCSPLGAWGMLEGALQCGWLTRHRANSTRSLFAATRVSAGLAAGFLRVSEWWVGKEGLL